MEKEKLKKAGFTHRYKPALEKVDKHCLGYSLLIKPGNSILIDLVYLEHLNEWKIDYIRFEGKEALRLIKNNLNGYDLESVVEFVEKFPNQTF